MKIQLEILEFPKLEFPSLKSRIPYENIARNSRIPNLEFLKLEFSSRIP